MLTWKIFMIIISVTSLTLVNVYSSSEPSSSSTPSRSTARFVIPRTPISQFIVYDPDYKSTYTMRYHPYNPFHPDIDDSRTCYQQIKLFCDNEIQSVSSENCITKAILYYNNQFGEETRRTLSDDVRRYYENVPITVGKFPLPHKYCKNKGPSCMNGTDFENTLTSSTKKNNFIAPKRSHISSLKSSMHEVSSLPHIKQHCQNIIPDLSATTDTINKILRTVLKIRYDVEALEQRQEKFEQAIHSVILENRNSNVINNQEEITSNQYNFFELLPIASEEQLINFENKLTDNSFKMQLIAELKRHSRKNLTATVRHMLRKLFDDSLLKEYSYVGQKKKKVFSSLLICGVIIEAVRKLREFENQSNSDIEAPIKINIAGAAFRQVPLKTK